MPEVTKGEPQIPAVTPYLEREQKLYPVEVPASAIFEEMVIVASNIMGCPCMLRTDTRFPLRTDDHIFFATEQDIHLEQMKLEALRAEDELKMQQKQNAIQWTMADVPPRPASRECPTLEQAFNYPKPESISKWEKKSKSSSKISAEHKARNHQGMSFREEKANSRTRLRQMHLESRCRSQTPGQKLQQARR
jgi:hypothetical protein